MNQPLFLLPYSVVPMSNPLLSMDGLPPFNKIKPEHVQPAVQQAIDDAKQRIADVLRTTDSLTWDSLVAPLEETDDRLSLDLVSSPMVDSVVNNINCGAAYEACLCHCWLEDIRRLLGNMLVCIVLIRRWLTVMNFVA